MIYWIKRWASFEPVEHLIIVLVDELGCNAISSSYFHDLFPTRFRCLSSYIHLLENFRSFHTGSLIRWLLVTLQGWRSPRTHRRTRTLMSMLFMIRSPLISPPLVTRYARPLVDINQLSKSTSAMAHNRPIPLRNTDRISGAGFRHRERKVSWSSSRPTTQLVDCWTGQEPRVIGDRKACRRLYTGGGLG